MSNNDAVAVAEYVRAELGPSDEWVRPAGYPDSLALCIVDSVYSLRVKYTSVINVLNNYRQKRREEGADPVHDSASDLLAAIDAAGGPEAAADTLFSNNHVAPGSKRLKSIVAAEAAQNLVDIGINTADEFRKAVEDSESEAKVEKAWTAVSGLGPASWDYLKLLTGIDATKADVWITRFVALALGEDSVSPARAKEALAGAATELGVSLTTLDHAVWRFASDREPLSE